MGAEDEKRFNDRIAATTIVNNAVIRCQLIGLPVTEDNVILCVADFFDPHDQSYANIVAEIMHVLEFTLLPGAKAPNLN